MGDEVQPRRCRNGGACNNPRQVVGRRSGTKMREVSGDAKHQQATTYWLDRIFNMVLFPIQTAFGALWWKLNDWLDSSEHNRAFTLRSARVQQPEPLPRSFYAKASLRVSLRGTPVGP